MADNTFEIPQAMRDLAEANIKQAHLVYDQLTDFVRTAVDAWMDALPASSMARGFKYVQDRATEIAMENAEAASAFVSEISDARTFQDLMTLQTKFVQSRMRAFVAQMHQLYGLVGEALQTLERAPGDRPRAAPFDPLGTDSAQVHDRVEELAKNVNSAFALAEKIAKAQTLGDVLALQTQFAQEQMQAYVAQTAGLQCSIGKAFRKLQHG